MGLAARMDVGSTLAPATRPVKSAGSCQTPGMTDQPLPMTDPSSRLAASRAAFAALHPRVAAGGPWPLAAQFGTEPEASWGPREVLAHTAEMLPYWLGEFERLVEAGHGPGDGVPFGRTADDPLRLGVLERDRTLPFRELFDRIDAGIGRWESRQPSLTAAEGSACGLHVRDGEVPATWIRDRFVIRHLEEHAVQLEEILAGPAGG